MKYIHSDKNHRLFLAGKVLTMLNAAGFVEVAMPNTEERVFARNVVVKNDKGEPVTTPVRVLVYTSIDRRSKEVRRVGVDAIRICGVRSYKDGTEKGCIKRKRVHRVGLIDDRSKVIITIPTISEMEQRSLVKVFRLVGSVQAENFCILGSAERALHLPRRNRWRERVRESPRF